MFYMHFVALLTSVPGALVSLHLTSQFPFKIKTSRKVKLLVRFIDFSRHSLVVVNHKDIKKQKQLLLILLWPLYSTSDQYCCMRLGYLQHSDSPYIKDSVYGLHCNKEYNLFIQE
jgi:hypothetical protein